MFNTHKMGFKKKNLNEILCYKNCKFFPKIEKIVGFIVETLKVSLFVGKKITPHNKVIFAFTFLWYWRFGKNLSKTRKIREKFTLEK